MNIFTLDYKFTKFLKKYCKQYLLKTVLVNTYSHKCYVLSNKGRKQKMEF